MKRKQSPATRIRGLKRDIRDQAECIQRLRRGLNQVRTELTSYRTRATQAEQNAAADQVRLDYLLRALKPESVEAKR